MEKKFNLEMTEGDLIFLLAVLERAQIAGVQSAQNLLRVNNILTSTLNEQIKENVGSKR